MASKVTIGENGQRLYGYLPLDYWKDQVVEFTTLLADFNAKRITPSSVIGKGYGNKSRQIANEWITEGLERAVYAVSVLEGVEQ